LVTKSQPLGESSLQPTKPTGAHDTNVLLPSTLTEEEQRANAEFLVGAYAENTRVAYRSQLKAWLEWCAQRDISFVRADSETLVTYLRERVVGVEIGGRYYKPAKPNSLRVARAAISKAYEVAGLPDITKSPKISEALRAHRNSAARAGVKVRQAEALTVEVLAAIRATALHPRRGRGGVESETHARQRGLVDIALVSLMRDCLLRRSEAAAVRWNDITASADGSGRLYVGVSKTDQEGEGALLFISRQTMRDLDAIRPPGAGEQLVFGLKPKAIGRRIAAAATAAGRIGAYSGHSARVGMARDLARAGEELPALMTAGRWKSADMVARYIAHESAGRGAVARFHRES